MTGNQRLTRQAHYLFTTCTPFVHIWCTLRVQGIVTHLTSEIYPRVLAPFFDDRRRSLASSTRT